MDLEGSRVSRKDEAPATPAGAQTVERACALLWQISRAGAEHARILDLCAATGLSRPTVHRILKSLAGAGFVRQDERTRRYGLGAGLFELGLAAPPPVQAFPEVTRLIDELAESTQDTAYLMMRSQDEVVCVWRAVGAFPIRANIVAPGDRRPLAASAAGLCLLGAMPAGQADRILNASRRALPGKCRLSLDELRQLVAHARRHGHSFGEGLVMDGVTGVGRAVPSRAGAPFLAISISGISTRITRQRLPTLLAALTDTAQRIAKMIDGQG
jgi:DNA-binding IclR family transcriptional regulator